MNHLVTSWPIQCRTRTVSTKYNSENKGILLIHAYETWIYKLHKNRQSFDEKSNNRATMRCSAFVSRSGFCIWPKIVHCPKRWVIANFWKIVAEGRETVDPTMHKMLSYKLYHDGFLGHLHCLWYFGDFCLLEGGLPWILSCISFFIHSLYPQSNISFKFKQISSESVSEHLLIY